MDGFKSLIPKKCKVIRDGAANVLDAVDLVPGDLVEFQVGVGNWSEGNRHQLGVERDLRSPDGD